MGSQPRWRPKTCVDCGEPGTAENPLSTRGLHEKCAISRMYKAADQMANKSGPYWERWQRSLVEQAQRIVASG